VSCPLYIYYGIICSLPLKLEMAAEFIKIEFKLPAGSCIIWDLIEDMHLMIYVLDVIQRRE